MSKITITRDEIVAKEPCEEWLAVFDAAYPSGAAEYDSTSHEDAARILGGAQVAWWSWAVEFEVAAPFRLTAGDWGVASAGICGCAVAGVHGTATAGEEGTARVGSYGVAAAGRGGSAAAGVYGTATVGYGGTARAGVGGIIAISRWDRRPRLVVGYIGETLDSAGDVLEADKPYRLDLDGRFVRADTTT